MHGVVPRLEDARDQPFVCAAAPAVSGFELSLQLVQEAPLADLRYELLGSVVNHPESVKLPMCIPLSMTSGYPRSAKCSTWGT